MIESLLKKPSVMFKLIYLLACTAFSASMACAAPAEKYSIIPGGVPLQLRFLRLRNNAVFFCCFSLKYREQQQSGQEWKKPCHVFSISRAGRESFKNLLLHEHAAEYASCPLKGYGGPFDKMFLRNYRGWHPGGPDTSSFQGKRKGRKEGRPFVFFPWSVWRC